MYFFRKGAPLKVATLNVQIVFADASKVQTSKSVPHKVTPVKGLKVQNASQVIFSKCLKVRHCNIGPDKWGRGLFRELFQALPILFNSLRVCVANSLRVCVTNLHEHREKTTTNIIEICSKSNHGSGLERC